MTLKSSVRSEIVRLRNSGCKYSEIAAMLSVNESTVGSVVREELGYQYRKLGLSREEKTKRVLKLRREGVGRNDIAKRLAMCPQEVTRILHSHGLGFRRARTQVHEPVAEEPDSSTRLSVYKFKNDVRVIRLADGDECIYVLPDGTTARGAMNFNSGSMQALELCYEENL